MTLMWQSFLLALTALLPLINPFGSALVLLSMVGDQTIQVYRRLALRVALSMFIFLIATEYLGTFVLDFFGISLAVIQVTGGLVIAATAWRLLFESDPNAHARGKAEEVGGKFNEEASLYQQVFYPFTFPITAGPGSVVVMLTLTAQLPTTHRATKALLHGGIMLAAATIALLVYLCYGYAPRITRLVSPGTVHGILRIIAFLLMCLGVQLIERGAYVLILSWMNHG
jgi:multiple antibiotic resistance protein